MKRSKSIDLSRMRKTAAVAITAIALIGCDEEEVTVVSSVEECAQKTKLSSEECQKAYDQAMAESTKAAPKYTSISDCEAEFGMEQCQGDAQGYNYYPMMDGFMVGLDMVDLVAGYYYHPVYLYHGPSSTMRGRYMTASGDSLGRPGQRSYSVSGSSMRTSTPRSTSTMSRGGFGKAAVARSSYSSSSRSSFGG